HLGQNHPTQKLANQLLDEFFAEYQDYNELVEKKGLYSQPIKLLKTGLAAWWIMGVEANQILRRYGSRFLLYRLLSLCAYLKQNRGPEVAKDLLEKEDGTLGVTDEEFRIRTNYVFWEAIFMAFENYKQFFPHADSLYNRPWLIAGREIHYKINELESLHPDMCKYTAKYPSYQFAYPKQEVGTHDVS
ncbi:hypothetical protein PCANC_25763, partial [Puccinia coronata f. sp. avenae]